MIVEKAAVGIIEEGRLIGKRHVAEQMAEQLMAQQKKGIKEVWKCCARLYTMEEFLYKKLNEAMRLIGSEEQEQVWRKLLPARDDDAAFARALTNGFRDARPFFRRRNDAFDRFARF
ncbi:unnamed protein product [Rotaria sp. Silwood1]|nr:unnamed protein product [Rotaria sp. Silwood1]